MIWELQPKHRMEFQQLAAICLRAGASCVQLRAEGGWVETFPSGAELSEPVLSVATQSGLSIHISGLTGVLWESIAETLLELFAHLLTNESELDGLTMALAETQDRLVAFYDLGKAIRGIIDIPRLLELLVGEVNSLLDISGAFAVITQSDRPAVIRQHGESVLPEQKIMELAASHQPTHQKNEFHSIDIAPIHGLSGMIFPILASDSVFTMLGIYAPSGEFSSPDIKLVMALAEQIGAQIENALLVQDSIASTRLETEMKLASEVQTALLPQTLPSIAGLDIYAVSIPARQVGGDFFDFILLPGHPLTFVLGDVTGKGMSSALLMTMTRTVARSAARNMPFSAPHQLVKRFNVDLLDDFSSVGMFTTAFVGVLNPVSHLLEYCNAGQSPVIYLSAGDEAQLLEAQDIPIGIFDGFDYSSFALALAPGDVFVVASDGFPEACNHAGEMFGYQRMQDVLSGCRQLSARAMSDRLFEAIAVFSEGQFQSDDQTIILIKILNVPPSTLVIPATYENVGMVDASLRAMLLKAEVPEPTIAICELAFHELLTNLVDHAYEGDARGEIRVFLSVEPARIIMETRDQGKAVALDLTEIRMPDPLELAESGYGLAIIQAQMDVMEYRIEDGQNIWRLVKNRT